MSEVYNLKPRQLHSWKHLSPNQTEKKIYIQNTNNTNNRHITLLQVQGCSMAKHRRRHRKGKIHKCSPNSYSVGGLRVLGLKQKKLHPCNQNGPKPPTYQPKSCKADFVQDTVLIWVKSVPRLLLTLAGLKVHADLSSVSHQCAYSVQLSMQEHTSVGALVAQWAHNMVLCLCIHVFTDFTCVNNMFLNMMMEASYASLRR